MREIRLKKDVEACNFCESGAYGLMLKATGRWFIIADMTVSHDNDIKIDTQSQQADQIRMAAEYGIDLPALVANLNRSCSERILRHQIALNTVMKLRKARKM